MLFADAASPQLFAELLAPNLALKRRPEGGRGGSGPTSELEGRLGARVLPDSFTVVDDPSQKEWRGRPLFGSYDVDREGVPAKPLRLVEKGVLKDYLLTRQPVRGFSGPTGARGCTAHTAPPPRESATCSSPRATRCRAEK